MKWTLLVFSFFMILHLAYGYDQKYCEDLTTGLTQVRKKLVNMPCSLLEKNEEEDGEQVQCESLGDVENDYKGSLAKLRIRQGIDALHKDLKEKGTDPKVVLDHFLNRLQRQAGLSVCNRIVGDLLQRFSKVAEHITDFTFASEFLLSGFNIAD